MHQMSSDSDTEFQLDNELDMQIRPVIQPIFEEIVSCYDKNDKALEPFFSCIQSKVVYLARRSIDYVRRNSGKDQLETNKLYVRNLIRQSAHECIQNGIELGLDTSRWNAMFQCIMGSCEKYVDLLINLLMREYSALMDKHSGVSNTKRPSPTFQKSPSKRQSPSKRISPMRRSISRSPNRRHLVQHRLSPHNRHQRLSDRRSPRHGDPRSPKRLSPRFARMSPRHRNLSRR